MALCVCRWISGITSDWGTMKAPRTPSAGLQDTVSAFRVSGAAQSNHSSATCHSTLILLQDEWDDLVLEDCVNTSRQS